MLESSLNHQIRLDGDVSEHFCSCYLILNEEGFEFIALHRDIEVSQSILLELFSHEEHALAGGSSGISKSFTPWGLDFNSHSFYWCAEDVIGNSDQ